MKADKRKDLFVKQDIRKGDSFIGRNRCEEFMPVQGIRPILPMED